ncbi:MAG: hypothetical protein PF904_09880 [Kiritimatiellae bacterium]|nr:hypothetical protein [Kiritimatiellia bacterium]
MKQSKNRQQDIGLFSTFLKILTLCMLLLPLSSVAETYFFDNTANNNAVLTDSSYWISSLGATGSSISAESDYIAGSAVTTPTVDFTFAGNTLQLVSPSGRLRMDVNAARTLTFQDLIFNGGQDLYFMGYGSPITLA